MKNNLFIIAQVITIISIMSYCFFWYKSLWSSWWSGIGDGIILAIVFLVNVVLFLCWSVYYGFYARDYWSHAYVFHILTGVVFLTIFVLGYEFIWDKLENLLYERKHAAWEQQLTTKEYTSEKLGITFHYVSDTFAYNTYGTTIIQEINDTIRLYIGEYLSSVIQVHTKDPKMTLMRAFRRDYKYSRFVIDKWDSLSNLPGSYVSILLHYDKSYPSAPIIDLPMDSQISADNTIYLIMDTEHPDRYMIIISWGIDLDASKTDSGPSKSWRSTVRFIP